MGLPFFLKSSVVKKYTLWPSNPPRQQSRKTLAIVKPPSLFSSNFSGMTAHSCIFTVDKNATCLLNKHGTSKHTGLHWMPLFIFELASLARTLSFLFIDSIAKKTLEMWFFRSWTQLGRVLKCWTKFWRRFFCCAKFVKKLFHLTQFEHFRIAVYLNFRSQGCFERGVAVAKFDANVLFLLFPPIGNFSWEIPLSKTCWAILIFSLKKWRYREFFDWKFFWVNSTQL